MLESVSNFIPQGGELVIIVIVIGVLIFGAKRFQSLPRRLARPGENLKREKLRATRNSRISKTRRQRQTSFQQV